uniref:Uncharacterized protein n=1 Tax=Arundo donax TaxID=35708 RepID=A0A0A9A1V4_ARUDO
MSKTAPFQWEIWSYEKSKPRKTKFVHCRSSNTPRGFSAKTRRWSGCT